MLKSIIVYSLVRVKNQVQTIPLLKKKKRIQWRVEITNCSTDVTQQLNGFSENRKLPNKKASEFMIIFNGATCVKSVEETLSSPQKASCISFYGAIPDVSPLFLFPFNLIW